MAGGGSTMSLKDTPLQNNGRALLDYAGPTHRSKSSIESVVGRVALTLRSNASDRQLFEARVFWVSGCSGRSNRVMVCA